MTGPTSFNRRDAIATGLAGTALLAGGIAAPAVQASSPLPGDADASARRAVWLDADWRFHLGHASDQGRDFDFGRNQRTYAKPGRDTARAAMPEFDDRHWRAVQVPHDWAVELPVGEPTAAIAPDDYAPAAHGFKAIGRDWPEHSVGWYRRHLPVGPADRGRSVWIEFDGVFRDSIVFVNGYVAGGSESGYAPFRVDIGEFLDFDGGPNVLAVRVDASLGEGWFYEGAGIYRNVRLVSAAPCHIPQWGVCVRPRVTGSDAVIDVLTTVANAQEGDASLTLRHAIIGPDGNSVGAPVEQLLVLSGHATREVAAQIALAAPRLWHPDTPFLYRLRSAVLRDGVVVDEVETSFGVRTIHFDGTTGFSINGKPLKLLGVCNHQDHAGVGSAIPDALHAWRVARSKEMGVNAWRSAHNPLSQALLDICDREGVMMIAETRRNSASSEAMAELDRMILSSRNHPSIILWSVGNEEPHQGTARGYRISRALAARCKQLDPTRQTTQAMDSGWDGGAADAVDVVGFNYRIDKIADWHRRHPDKPVIGSETGSTVATRGAYRNDPARKIVRAYDTEHPWWASTAEAWWTIVDNSPYIAGGFIWTGFDYRGEPTPFTDFPAVSSYFGVMDLCGFPKDNYYYYRAWWRPEQPLVHLLPHWNWAGSEGEPIDVWVHGNCPEVELRLNGKSLGRKAMPRNGHLEWQVPYAPGRIEAVGIAQGRVVARDQRVTAGAPARLRLSTERRRLAADGRDVAMIRAEVTDRAGNLVPTADLPLNFTLSGPVRLIGVGNGNPTSLEPDKGHARRAFNGLAQAIVQSAGQPGLARLHVTAEGVAPASIDLNFHQGI